MSTGTPIQVRLQKDELDILDRYRREQLDPPTRGRALKELARAALFGSASSQKKGEDRARDRLPAMKALTDAAVVQAQTDGHLDNTVKGGTS